MSNFGALRSIVSQRSIGTGVLKSLANETVTGNTKNNPAKKKEKKKKERKGKERIKKRGKRGGSNIDHLFVERHFIQKKKKRIQVI